MSKKECNTTYNVVGTYHNSAGFTQYKLLITYRDRQTEGTRGQNFEFETSSRAAVLVLITLLKLLSFSQSEF